MLTVGIPIHPILLHDQLHGTGETGDGRCLRQEAIGIDALRCQRFSSVGIFLVQYRVICRCGEERLLCCAALCHPPDGSVVGINLHLRRHMVDESKDSADRPEGYTVVEELSKATRDGELLADGLDELVAGLHLDTQDVLCQCEVCLRNALPPVTLILQTVSLVVDVEGVVVTPVLLILRCVLDVDAVMQAVMRCVIDPTAGIGAGKRGGQEVDILRHVGSLHIEAVVNTGHQKITDIYHRFREETVNPCIELIDKLLIHIAVEIVEVGHLGVIQQRNQLT